MPITLIVEDGTMPAGANSYVDIASADNYLAQRGAYAWVGKEDDEKASALIRAADTLNTFNWNGADAESGRIMAWPRKHMLFIDKSPVQENFIPDQIKSAQCEIAADILLNQADPLAPVDTSQGAVTSEKVDVVSLTYATPETNNYNGITGYPAVDGLLRPFLSGNEGKFGVVELGRG